MVSRDLAEWGQEVVDELARECAAGARALQLQLLASPFYEAVKREIRTTATSDPGKARSLLRAAEQCRRAASCPATPARIVVDLRAAVAMISGERPLALGPPIPARPTLRLIQGGRA